MASYPHATLSPHEIVVGCDYEDTFTIDPPPGWDDDDVTDSLTGATITAELVATDADGTSVATLDWDVDETTREITLALAAADTEDLEPGVYRWRVTVTESAGGSTWPVRMPPEIRVRAT